MKVAGLWELGRCLFLVFALGTGWRAAALERWLMVNQNLWVDQNVTNLVVLIQRAAKAGYTHLQINDSKFSRLATMDAHYFANVALIQQAARGLSGWGVLRP